MVHPPDRLAEDRRDVEYLEFWALLLVLVLGYRVGHYDFVDAAGVDARDSIAAKDAVGDEDDDLESALALEKLGGAGDGVARVDDVVDKDADSVGDVADEHHACVSLFVVFDGTTFLFRDQLGRPEGEGEQAGSGVHVTL